MSLLLGKFTDGSLCIASSDELVHLYIGGLPNYGHSNLLLSILLSIVCANSPKLARVVILEPDGIDLSVCSSLPHMMAPIATTRSDIASIIRRLFAEIELRTALFVNKNARSLTSYNAKVETDVAIPKIFVIVDEIDSLFGNGKYALSDTEQKYFETILEKANSVGISIVASSTESPNHSVVKRFPSVAMFRSASRKDSLSVLGTDKAFSIRNIGEIEFLPIYRDSAVAVNTFLVNDKDIDYFLSKSAFDIYGNELNYVLAADPVKNKLPVPKIYVKETQSKAMDCLYTELGPNKRTNAQSTIDDVSGALATIFMALIQIAIFIVGVGAMIALGAMYVVLWFLAWVIVKGMFPFLFRKKKRKSNNHWIY